MWKYFSSTADGIWVINISGCLSKFHHDFIDIVLSNRLHQDESGDTDPASSSTIPLLVSSCTLTYFLNARTFGNEIKKSETRAYGNPYFQNKFFNTVTQYHPRQDCFEQPDLQHTKQTPDHHTYQFQHEFSEACLPDCLGNVVLILHPALHDKHSEGQALILSLFFSVFPSHYYIALGHLSA